MTLLVQHGYGKTDKIERALEAEYVGGVILGAKSETPDNIARYLDGLRENHAPEFVLFDPQFHIATVDPANYGKLPRYPYFTPGLSRRDFIRATQIDGYVDETIQYQLPLATTGIIAPTVRVVSFTDSSSQIALQLADASAAYWTSHNDERPLYVPLVIDEAALDNRGDLDAFLDALTLMECDGYYLVVARTNQVYSPQFDAQRLAALMYVCYVLQVINGFTVICGYSDFPGLLQIAAGAEAIATGWYQSLRYFCVGHLRPRSFGRQPRPRYSSLPALESLLISDLGRAFEAGVADTLRTDTDEDARFRTTHPERASWPRDVEVLHHWATLSGAVAEMSEMEPPDALAHVREWIDRAENTLEDARLQGVEFEPTVGGHFSAWRDAIDMFEEAASLSEGM